MADLTDGLTVADPPPETSDPPEGESPPAADRETVRQAIAQLKDLPCSVPVVQKAIEAVQDPTCSNGQLELLLSADQGITTRLLRLANSAYFSVSREVSTLSMAVALIGYGRLQTILRHILVAEVFDLLSAKSPAASRIWKTAIAAGAASRSTAQACCVGDPEELLAAGLLHNVGELALLCRFPDQFLAGDEPDAAPAEDALPSVFEVDSGTAGQWLLDGWLFPAIFGMSCRQWPDPLAPSVKEHLRPQVAAVHVGVKLARFWVEGFDFHLALPRLSPGAVHALALDGETITQIHGSLEEGVKEVLEVLDLL